MGKLKHNFKVNQVWVSQKYPERSFFIYQLNCPYVDEFQDSNEESFYESVLINKILFNKIVEEYQEKHNVKDRTTTYPFCIFKEGHINSLKRYVKQWECNLLCEEDFEIESYEGGELTTTKYENEAIKFIWNKYSN